MASGKFWLRPPVLLALCLVSVGGIVTLIGRLATGPAVAFKFTELTKDPGIKAYPALSPDGQRLAYSARAGTVKDDRFHIFVRDMIAGTSAQLTEGAQNDVSPAWSPDGARLAFVRVSEGQSACVVMTASGADQRQFPGCAAPGDETQPLPAVSWMPDGQSLVVVQSSDQQPAALAKLTLSDGAFHPLTHPPAGAEDSTPAVSPDGASIAFVRSTSAGGADVFLCDPSGANPRAATFDGSLVHGIAWTRSGQDLVYTANRLRGWRLWRLPAYGGSPHDLVVAAREAQYVTVASGASRLVYTVNPTVSVIWRAKMGGDPDDPPDEHAVIRSSGSEKGPRYSPDGKLIAVISDQTGADEIWLSDPDGGNRIRVTNFKGPNLSRIRWSADGKSLIFDAAIDQRNDVYTVSAAAGAKPIQVQHDAINGAFSRDGKQIYFQSRNRIWKANADGTNPQQLSSTDGAAQPVESADGKWIYFRLRRSFVRVPIGGGDEEQAIVPEHELMWSTTIQPAKQGVYYIEFERSVGAPVVSFFDYATKKSQVVFVMKSFGGFREGATFSVSPDGKYILYSRVDQGQTNFELVDNFR